MTEKEKLYYKMLRLDWIKILNSAIEGRPTSWYPSGFTPIEFTNLPIDGKPYKTEKYSPAEWRNASDELCSAVLRAMVEKKIVKDIWSKDA